MNERKLLNDLMDERLTVVASKGWYEIINVDGHQFLVVERNNIIPLHNKCTYNPCCTKAILLQESCYRFHRE